MDVHHFLRTGSHRVVDRRSEAPPATKELLLTDQGAQQGSTTPLTPINGAFGQSGPVRLRNPNAVAVRLALCEEKLRRSSFDRPKRVLRIAEDHSLDYQRIQLGGSFDTVAGPLNNMFDFQKRDESTTSDFRLAR